MKRPMVLAAGAVVAGSLLAAAAPAAAEASVARVCVTVTEKRITATINNITLGESVAQPTTCVEV